MIVIRLRVFRGYTDIQSGQIHPSQNLSAGKEKDVRDKGFQIFVFYTEFQRNNHTQLII